MTSPENPPAGWFPDPHNPALSRWWDGQQWTQNTQPAQSAPPGAPATPLQPALAGAAARPVAAVGAGPGLAGPAGPGGLPPGQPGQPGFAGTTAPPPTPPATPVYKKWWFWALIALALILLIYAVAHSKGTAASPPVASASAATTAAASPAATPTAAESSAAPSPTPAPSSAAATSEAPAPTTAVTSSAALPPRDNSSAQPATLGAGQYSVGTDVQPGRYVIAGPAGESGNLQVDREGEILPWVNEILGDPSVIGVPSVTTDLKAGDTIQISGLSQVTFTPAQTALSNQLSTGRWIVGLDIAAGRYTATPPTGESGNLIVQSEGDLFPAVNEILGGSLGVPSYTVTLTDGQEIEISALSSVTFTP